MDRVVTGVQIITVNIQRRAFAEKPAGVTAPQLPVPQAPLPPDLQQRASGIAITAVGTTAAGGSAGKVNVRLVGTGLGSDVAPFSTNNAYKPTAVTAVDCTGRTKALIHVKAAVTDLRSLPTLSVVPFLKNAATGEFSQGTVVALAPLSAIGKALQQSFTLDVLGASGLVVLVDTISGQGTAATVYVELM
jgi:hypothetical protein